MAMSCIVLLCFFLITVLTGEVVHAYNNKKCAACEVVSSEIITTLRNERRLPSMKVGARLDSDGNYHNAKTINYQTSELRIIELFEDFCSKMQDYSEVVHEDGSIVYQKTSNTGGDVVIDGTVTLGGNEAIELRYVCDTLMEDHEETLTELLLLEDGHKKIKKTLCTNYCKGKPKGKKKKRKEESIKDQVVSKSKVEL